MLDQPSKSEHADESVRTRFELAYSLRSENRIEAIRLLEENAEAGCSDSMVLLGTLLADGDDSEKKRSIELYRKAAELGNSSGYRNLAYCYAVGINVERDKAKAVSLYLESSERGNARAACNLGVMYDYGNGTEKNFEEAFRWYTVSAEGGCTRGMTNLGEYYLWGKGTEQNIREAERWFLASGSPRATYRLAEIYLDVENNREKGLGYLIDSSEKGYSRAMARYAKILESSDYEKAVELYTKAAAKGSKDAIEFLTAHGLPVPEPPFMRRNKKAQ